MTTPLHYLSAKELAQKIHNKEMTSVEATKYFLERISKYNEKFSVFTAIFTQKALQAAEYADKLLEAGIILSPFHGVPISIKEHFHLKNSIAHYGSKSYAHNLTASNSKVVDLLISSGMPILGKTAMTEFAFGLSGQNPTMGTPWNPWSLKTLKSPGGSSSGGGVALALGLSPIALGGDTGGSVRAPAAHTYNIGFKPSSGMISRANSMSLSNSLDVVGVISKTVTDAVIMTELLSSPDIDDPLTYSKSGLLAQYNFLSKNDGKHTIPAIYKLAEEAWPIPVSKEYGSYWINTLETLHKNKSFSITTWKPDNPSFFRSLGEYNSTILAYEAYQEFGDIAENPKADLWDVVRERLLNGKSITKIKYNEALEYRELCKKIFQAQFPANGILLMPAMDQATQELDPEDLNHSGLGAFLRPANFIDSPAITLPSGLDHNQLPLSIQLIAHTAKDRQLLTTATIVEETLKNTRKQPNIT